MARARSFARMLACGLPAALAACAAAGSGYMGATVTDLGGDLRNVVVTMKRTGDRKDVDDYVTCVVAGQALKEKAGFARKVRTQVTETGGIWTADAVYSISSALPRGLKTIDAEVAAADCEERNIPTV